MLMGLLMGPFHKVPGLEVAPWETDPITVLPLIKVRINCDGTTFKERGYSEASSAVYAYLRV